MAKLRAARSVTFCVLMAIFLVAAGVALWIIAAIPIDDRIHFLVGFGGGLAALAFLVVLATAAKALNDRIWRNRGGSRG